MGHVPDGRLRYPETARERRSPIPAQADKPLFKIAPIIAFVPSFAIVAVIPFTENLYFTDTRWACYLLGVERASLIRDFDRGLVVQQQLFALLGAMRSAAQ